MKISLDLKLKWTGHCKDVINKKNQLNWTIRIDLTDFGACLSLHLGGLDHALRCSVLPHGGSGDGDGQSVFEIEYFFPVLAAAAGGTGPTRMMVRSADGKPRPITASRFLH